MLYHILIQTILFQVMPQSSLPQTTKIPVSITSSTATFESEPEAVAAIDAIMLHNVQYPISALNFTEHRVTRLW